MVVNNQHFQSTTIIANGCEHTFLMFINQALCLHLKIFFVTLLSRAGRRVAMKMRYQLSRLVETGRVRRFGGQLYSQLLKMK